MTPLDAVTGTRLLVENAFSHLTWHEAACRQVGFKGISQVWKEEPAWYFWQEEIPGAFLLRLHGDEPLADSQFVSMALHYYPAPDDTQHTLSRREAALRADDAVFDQPTGTPRFEAFETCLPHFIAAEIGLMIGPDNRLQLMVFSTDREREHPVYAFIELLVGALNFEAGTHHVEAGQLEDASIHSLLLAYDRRAFTTFQETFGLDVNVLSELCDMERLARWRRYAHLEASCTINGTCSCH